jgi:hypothetical protein
VRGRQLASLQRHAHLSISPFATRPTERMLRRAATSLADAAVHRGASARGFPLNSTHLHRGGGSVAVRVPTTSVEARCWFANVAATGGDSHSSTSQLNLSSFYGIGGALRGCEARVKGFLGGVYGV